MASVSEKVFESYCPYFNINLPQLSPQFRTRIWSWPCWICFVVVRERVMFTFIWCYIKNGMLLYFAVLSYLSNTIICPRTGPSLLQVDEVLDATVDRKKKRFLYLNLDENRPWCFVREFHDAEEGTIKRQDPKSCDSASHLFSLGCLFVWLGLLLV